MLTCFSCLMQKKNTMIKRHQLYVKKLIFTLDLVILKHERHLNLIVHCFSSVTAKRVHTTYEEIALMCGDLNEQNRF